MAFVNFSLFAFGSLLMGLPILLHLLMRQRPHHQLFPALRFLHRRQISSRRQMRLRNWLLLALRLAVIGLFAAMLARPSVDSAVLGYWLRALLLALLVPVAVVALAYAWLEKKGGMLLTCLALISSTLLGGFLYQVYGAISTAPGAAIGDADAPVAVVLVFDTSPRMGLRDKNRTRLEEARMLGRELVKQLPADSEVAVIDASTASTTFSLDVGTAVNMIDSLRVTGIDYPLHELVARGIELVRGREDKRKELYVFTELSQEVWQPSEFQAVATLLAQDRRLSFFILDVGVATPRNLQLSQLRIPATSLPRGRPLRIAADVNSLNVSQEFAVEVLIEQPDPTRPVIVDGKVLLPEAVPRDRGKAAVTPGGSAPLAFELRGLPVGVHHGHVRISAEDGLAVDNVRYFTVEVHEPWPVLLAASNGAVPRYVELVLSPYRSRELNQTWFACKVIDAQRLAQHELSEYAVVALLDPSPLPSEHLRELADYVTLGGSLAMFLGQNAQPAGRSIGEFNEAAGDLLPGPLHLRWRAPWDGYLFVAPRNFSHPLLSSFRGYETLIPWDQASVLRHWSFGELQPGAVVVTRFSNDQPAIVETSLGAGRVLTMTTPVSDARNDPNRRPWNYLPTAEENWPFFVLIRELFVYLAQTTDHRWNYDVGQVVTMPTGGAASQATTWQLFTPEADWRNLRSQNGTLTVATTDAPGTYRSRTRRPEDPPLGFSVNLPQPATDLRRIEPGALEDILGTDSYTLARGAEELARGIGHARVGRELYPFLLLLIATVLIMEYLLSNRFYSGQSTALNDAQNYRRVATAARA